mmetsp:Transcript_27655/g.44220  ORF Transcript_27655/g.44220 Transcript_27655/m.44220 type:complete len:297 (-) Transcript_27655:2335-3225(-)|eukprot:CAMPEP_0203750146 /NCGR_PEP_ID=MMETSP0098-20131031/4425_1 /ASSEMBLY_ACC=CAM_ASM_000208 /TAXON_ID=96639 /ORGANISM=" , Strain NY0313808BC1" /LENGTH=296 /DNA_ID=CAMNT_0050639309 /DNA_START=169 /DNA_END=1059 /DNA_ORIENTATION=-
MARRRVVDAHIHLCEYKTADGLANSWVENGAAGFQRDWTLEDFVSSAKDSDVDVVGAIFVECFNDPPVEEAKWVLQMVDDPRCIVKGVVGHIQAQKGKQAVVDFLDPLRDQDGKLPKGLKGGRCVFMHPSLADQTPAACLEDAFLQGLSELEKNGLLWEFCCRPEMAPNLSQCCEKFPGMKFIVDHIAHNGNEGGEMEQWGPAMDKLGKLPNVYVKLGACEEWDVKEPAKYMERAIQAFGFDKVLYESNWFVSEAMGFPYDRTAKLVLEVCNNLGATHDELDKVFHDNAVRVYNLN